MPDGLFELPVLALERLQVLETLLSLSLRRRPKFFVPSAKKGLVFSIEIPDPYITL